MNVDFSLFKNIDFTSRDNLLFSGIIFIVIIILLVVCLIIVNKIYNFILRFLKKILGAKNKKSKSVQSGAISPEKSKAMQGVNDEFSATRAIGGEQSGNTINTTEKRSENVSGNDFKVAGISPMQKATETANFKLGDKKIEGKNESQQSYKEKEAKGISESLGKLKADQDRGKDTIESKMPARGPKVEDLSHQPIKINRPKDFTKKEGETVKNDEERGFVGGTGKKDIFGNEIKKNEKSFEKGEIKKTVLKKTSDKSAPKDDGTIFEGQQEVSRRHIEHEVRVSPKVWQASRAIGLNLSPIERSKLIKEVFSPEYGVNISKKDLQTSLRKLNRKMQNSTNDAKSHEKIRKEIKFFKKIGGIK